MLFAIRSYFSLLRGCISPEAAASWVGKHQQPGQDAAVLLDRMNFYGLVRFLAACKREGVRAMVGMDISADPAVPLPVLATGPRGYGALNRLVSGFMSVSPGDRIQSRGEQEISRMIEHLPALFRESQDGNGADELVFVLPGQLWDAGLADGLLQELQQLSGGSDYVRSHIFAGIFAGQSTHSAHMLSRSLGIDCMTLLWGSWRNDQERERIDLLRAIDLCQLVGRLDASERSKEVHRLTEPQKARRLFALEPRWNVNTERIIQRAWGGELLDSGFVFPSFRGMHEATAFSHLTRLCRQGALGRYGSLRPDVKTRLDYELQIIRAKGFSSYFLVVNDIVSQSQRTCGRGSSAASIVSYTLGITHVDPLEHELFFERFLNMGRADPPDIDVDFPWDEREKTLAYVFETYPGQAAMVADHVTFGPRSAIREPAKAMGIGDDEIDRFIELWNLGQGQHLPQWLRREAMAIRGIPRFIGTHPGGVVITPGPISNWTHTQISPLGWPVIAWEKDAAEDAGLVKIDILGNRSLAVLRDCMAAVNRHRGQTLAWDSFSPIDDEPTQRFIESGETLGIFYVESPATRQLLAKMRFGDYPHLIVASSIIRPAANRFINEYVRRLHGKSWQPIDLRAEQVLRETCGIMVYQEDVSRVAMAVSGFTAAEADGLRKVLSRKDRALKLSSWQRRFFEGGRAMGASYQAVEDLWEMIRSFEGYSFCKPHSASYALLSYKLAWMKLHYPLEFYVAVINNGGGYYSRQTYVNAVRRLGQRLLVPDVNKSNLLYEIEYKLPDTTVRAGLLQIAGLSKSCAQRIVQFRISGGPYTSLENFLLRVGPGILELRALIKSGSLDSLEPQLNRPAMFWLLPHLLPRLKSEFRNAERERNGELSKYTNDLDFFPDEAAMRPQLPSNLRDYSRLQKLKDEGEILGIFLSVHPADIFVPRARSLAFRLGLGPFIDSRSIPGVINRVICICGLLVCGKEVHTSGKEAMSFVSFEDRYSMFETVFFPEAYRNSIGVLDRAIVFLIEGTVREDLGALSIHCTNLHAISRIGSKNSALSAMLYRQGGMGAGSDRKAG